MRQIKTILVLILLLTIVSCKKDSPIVEQNNFCGTDETTPLLWMQNVTKSDLIGDWKIIQISYSKEKGQTVYFDTTYSLNAPLTLNANGTGMLYSSIPLNWALTIKQRYPPKLTLTNIDTLFHFPVNCIHNDTVDTYMTISPPQTLPHTRFSVTVGAGLNGQIEQGYIDFERQ